MTPTAYPASPRVDFIGALVIVAFGSLVLLLSWQMDRLQQQGATLHTFPGLWPGMVGGALAALGGALALRSLTRARHLGWHAGETDDTELAAAPRFAMGVALMFVYALLLVGRGLPFWLGTALFVTLFVYLFQHAQRLADGKTRRGIVVALVCGVATAAIVTLVFEQLFLVRLP